MKNNKNYNKEYETHFSNAQTEVWQMKNEIYESVKDLTLNKALHQILESSQKITEQFIKEKKISIN